MKADSRVSTSMSSRDSGTGSGEAEIPKRYLVSCDECAFEADAQGHEEAQRVAQEHTDETDHEVVALEYPRNKRPA